MWLKQHPDFAEMPGVQQDRPLDFVEIKAYFDQAHASKPADSQVLLALGVLMHTQRDFGKAEEYFVGAIKEDPTNHSLWNKYGASLAQQLQTVKSMAAYQQALDLRPNYVRTIVNLGLAFNNNADFKAASNCFINAMILNPQAEHLRAYLHAAFIQMKRFDLVEKMKMGDMMAFKDEFDLIDPNNMRQ